jgi:hypothetical protein
MSISVLRHNIAPGHRIGILFLAFLGRSGRTIEATEDTENKDSHTDFQLSPY